MQKLLLTFILLLSTTMFAQDERQTLPLGTEPVRDDAACDNPATWEGLMLDSPYYHEYTMYQGQVIVDGDSSDAAWQAIPWTRCDVWEASYEEAYPMITFWEDFDAFWTSWKDKQVDFKWLWNEENGVMYLLVKDIDDAYVLSHASADSFGGPESLGGDLWQGDCFEIGFAPFVDGLPPTSQVWKHEGYFTDVDGNLRFFPVAASWQGSENPLELADGDSESEFEETTGKAIRMTKDGDTRIYEMAIKLLPGMEKNVVWAWGLQVDEADEESDENSREGVMKFGMGKRKPNTWSSILFSSESVVTAGVEKQTAIIKQFQLEDNYPNPFNPTTTIRYHLNVQTEVNLTVYDVTGRKIAELVNAAQAAGSYSVAWEASEYPSGLYLYQLRADDATSTKSMLLIK